MTFHDAPARDVESVSFEVRTFDDKAVARYSTVGRVHPVANNELKVLLETRERGRSTLKVAQEIYKVLSRVGTTVWEVTPVAESLFGHPAEGIPVLAPAIPHLSTVISNPGSIDNELTARWLSKGDLIRFVVSLRPQRGYAAIAIDTYNYSRNESERMLIKLLIPATAIVGVGEAATILLNQVREVLAHMYHGGNEEVQTYLRSNQEVVALAATGSHEELEGIDKQLLIDGGSALFSINRSVSSGTTVGLAIGKRVALLKIVLNPEEPERQYRVRFKCQDTTEQLSAGQIHFLRKAYDLITSDNKDKKTRGLKCLLRGCVAYHPFLREPQSTVNVRLVTPQTL